MKQLLFAIHLPVMGFDSNGDNNKKNAAFYKRTNTFNSKKG